MKPQQPATFVFSFIVLFTVLQKYEYISKIVWEKKLFSISITNLYKKNIYSGVESVCRKNWCFSSTNLLDISISLNGPNSMIDLEVTIVWEEKT